MRPFVVKEQTSFTPQKSLFNKIVGDSLLELRFAKFLDQATDVVSFVKNYFALNFKLDYINALGEISNYYPDFIVKLSEREVYVVETKGLKDLDDPLKIRRLKQWCEDVNKSHSDIKYGFVYVDQENYDRLMGEHGSTSPQQIQDFRSLLKTFRQYQD